MTKAEVYLQTENGGWRKVGQTGTAIKMNERNVPSWEQAVFLPAPANEQQQRTIRIRVMPISNSALSIRLMNAQNFFRTSGRRTFFWSIALGILVCLCIVIFTGGVFFRDVFYFYFGGVLLSLVGHILSVQGTGMAYVWQFLSGTDKADNMVFFFSLGAIYCGTGALLSDNKKILPLKHPSTIINGLFFICLTISVLQFFVFSPNILLTTLTLIIIVIMIIFLCICIRTSFFHTSADKQLYMFWTFGVLFIIIRQIFHLVRAKSSAPLFRLFDNDMDIPIFVAAYLFTIPIIRNIIIRLRSKIAQLEINNAAAEERTRAADTKMYVYSNIAFSLMNPITDIRSSVLSADSGTSDETKRIVEKDSAKLSSLMNMLYALAQYEAGEEKIDTNGKLIQLQPFIINCLEEQVAEIRSRGNTIEIRTSISAAACVKADQHLLAAFFKYMLEAAGRQASPDSPVLVAIDYRNAVVSYSIHIISAPISEQDAKIILTLTAAGSPADENEKERFHSVIDTWGVNMHLVNRIISLYNGSISITPDLNGNTFSACLVLEPVHISDFSAFVNGSSLIPTENSAHVNTSAENLPKIRQKPLFSETLFIIEENMRMRQNLEEMFGRFYHVQTASTKQDALQLSASVVPDLIVVSDSDPSLTDTQFLSALKNDPHLSPVPIFFLLTYTSQKQRLNLFKSGVVMIMEKPFLPDELTAEVNAFLDNRRKAKALILTDISSAVRRDIGALTTASPNTDDMGHFFEHTNASAGDSSVPSPTYVQMALFTAANLSKREIEIAMYIAAGKSDKEIAKTLNISPATVAVHDKKIFKKLDIHSRNELAAKLK